MNTTNNFDTNLDVDKRLSTIYESPSPQPRTEEEDDDDAYDKLIVYDVANIEKVNRYYLKLFYSLVF
jgi:hypothetical protein